MARNQSIPLSIDVHMEAFEGLLKAQVEAFEPEMRELVSYGLQSKGKRIRPLLVMSASSSMVPEIIQVAVAVELIHLATLVHDDVLDSAEVRRNLSSVGCKYGNKVAILLGDAIVAHALKLVADSSTIEVVRAITAAARRLCTGEIYQTFWQKKLPFLLEDYFYMIELKTAELFQVGCYLGSKLSGGAEETVNACQQFGRLLGVAYQLLDDMIDIWGSENKVGKTLGSDLMSGKCTLPILLLLPKLSLKEQGSLFQQMQEQTISREEILQLLNKYAVRKQAKEQLIQKIDAAEEVLFSSSISFGVRKALLAVSQLIREHLSLF